MRQVFRWAAYAVLACLVVAVVLWSVARLRGPDAEQRAALATMQAEWKPPGRNAFPLFWQLAYDVPERAQAAVAAEDLRRMAATPPPGSMADGDTRLGLWDFEGVARERYPELGFAPAERDLLCSSRGGGCLSRVRGDLPRAQALVEAHARLFERVASLADYDHVRNPLPARIDGPLPPLQAGTAPMTRHAVSFVRGDVATALAGTCRDLATWRRLAANSDTMLVRMAGIAYASEGYGGLLAEMLAELPADHPLPPSCAAAVAPAAATELRVCNAMQGEFALFSAYMRGLRRQAEAEGTAIERVQASLLFDPEATIADAATGFAPACADAELRRIEADASALDWPGGRSVWRVACAGNPVGCILGDIARPAYTDYVQRAQDHGARLQLLATLLWLREQADQDQTLERLLAARPAAMRSPTRDIEVGEDGRSLRIRQFFERRGEFWSVPLPRELWRDKADG